MLEEIRHWVEQQGLSPDGEIYFELLEKGTNRPIAILDLVWERDLQNRDTAPVALIIDNDEALKIAQKHGYRCFTDSEEFKQYVRDEILGVKSPEE